MEEGWRGIDRVVEGTASSCWGNTYYAFCINFLPCERGSNVGRKEQAATITTDNAAVRPSRATLVLADEEGEEENGVMRKP